MLLFATALCVVYLSRSTDGTWLGYGGSSNGHEIWVPGACVCANSDVYVSLTACPDGSTLGLLRRGLCTYSTGEVQTSCGHTWIGIVHKGQDAWVPEQHLDMASNSKCSDDNSTGNATDLEPTQQCLDCICFVEGCRPGCDMDVGSLSCGYFQIKEPYYRDCGSPGSDWKSCANDKACATQCVIAYMKRYALTCTGGRTPTCEDYSKIHGAGPLGCRKGGSVEAYWERVKRCLGG